MHQATIIKPTTSQCETVIKWLKQEHLSQSLDKSDFYYNRKNIRQALRDNKMICLAANGLIVGFSIYSLNKQHTAIDIFEIRPGYRRKGYGQQFAKHLLKMLIDQGASNIKIECSPATSEKFWRKLGFTSFDKEKNEFSNPILIFSNLILPGFTKA